MENENNNLWKAKAIITTNSDWDDAISLASKYYEESLKDYTAGVPDQTFTELRWAYDEVRRLEGERQDYIKLLLEDKVLEALKMADDILFGPQTEITELRASTW